jgi:hypothetical protein
MQAEVPVILIASASSYERHRLTRALNKTGWKLCEVENAQQAARALAGNGETATLVIDSGILESLGDAQWRLLRSRHPQLGTVVRCLIPRGGIWRTDLRTFLVSPDDTDGLCQAIGILDRQLALLASTP